MKTPEERFWSKVDKTSNPNGCWEWTASKYKDGYGRYWINNKTLRAHRYSYEIHNIPITNDLYVCHTCDNPACVNPAHLFLGTPKDNMDDKVSKGRCQDQKGLKNPFVKLSEADILDIRSRKLSSNQYIKKYGISQTHFYAIINRKTWTHI